VSKEIIPVVFSRDGVKVALPELEIIEPVPSSKVAAV
jgi:KUP system potassium uptake protein